jgi:hypothetical protein
LQQARADQDLLVVYTQAAANRVGGDGEIINQARIAVALTNKAYFDSGINLQLNLMAVRKVRGRWLGGGCLGFKGHGCGWSCGSLCRAKLRASWESR